MRDLGPGYGISYGIHAMAKDRVGKSLCRLDYKAEHIARMVEEKRLFFDEKSFKAHCDEVAAGIEASRARHVAYAVETVNARIDSAVSSTLKMCEDLVGMDLQVPTNI